VRGSGGTGGAVEEGDQFVAKTHLALVAIPVVALFPAAALLIPGGLAHSLLLRWPAVPVAITWAGFLSWYSTQAAVRRLESHGAEIFSRLRVPA